MRALCLSLFLSVSLSLFSQITVTVENTPLRAALKKIEQVSDYKFFYNEKLAGLDQAVTFSVSNATIAQTMQKVLAGKELTYKMESDNVVVLLHKEAVSQKTKTITGTIVDSSGEPVIGASIVVKGTTNGTITDVDGNYSLSNVPENSTVSISYIGYQPLSYPASSKELSRVILKEDAEMLDEVIVVGYGTTKKANLSGAVDQISSKEIEHRVSGNAGQVLQGMIPNLNVSFSDGSINSKASFDVRGVGSINGGSPLVLIDGVEGDMNYINPKDIESISVLKDASSAAIYGARAAFGVVLITTKNPNAGKIQVNYSNHFGWSNPTINTDNFITDGLEWARLSDKLSLLENTSTYLGYTEEDYAYMEALAALCETQSGHAEYEQWIRAMKLYGGYLKNIMKYVYPYGMVPSGIYHKDEVKDSANFYAVQVGIRSGADKDFEEQLENGIRLDKEHYLRIFPVWFSFKGNIAVHLSTGKAAAICARVLKDKELKDIAEQQLFWVVGRNPFGQSMIYGEGSNYPQLYTALPGETVGEIPVGMQSYFNEDAPYWPQFNTATYKEVWGSSAARWLMLVSEF